MLNRPFIFILTAFLTHYVYVVLCFYCSWFVETHWQ